jgi:DNA-binding transcriptional LysR family regulator
MKFRHLDLNLLRVFAAIYRTNSVTAAARQLALSQPATSNALARLRAFFGDDLFVRSPRGLHPTRAAQRIGPGVIAQLQALESIALSAESFDPIHSSVHWRLSLSDLGEILFMPALAQALREESPHSHVSNVAVAADQVSAALEARDIDLALGILQPAHSGIASESLFQERFVAITAAGWSPPTGRSGKALSAKQLAGAALAVAAPTATFHGGVEQMLRQFRLGHRTVLRARHYGALPELVMRTDLLAIVPRMFGESLAPRYPVRVWELPDLAPRYDVRMLWHRSATSDAAHAWLRSVLRRLFRREGNSAKGKRT